MPYLVRSQRLYAVYLKIYKDIGLVVFKIRKKDLSDDVCV